MVVCTVCLSLSAASRIVTEAQPVATILITIGQVFNGVANTVVIAIPPAVSETWFHVSERTTATAVSCMSSALGAAASFLLGPYMVSMPALNGTVVIRNETDISAMKHEMRVLHYLIFGISSALMVSTLLYMPAKPETAPSKTASLSRYSFKQGFLKLIRSSSMWYIGCLYAIPLGTYASWASVLYPIIQDLGFTQVEVGWIGFYCGIAGIVAAVIVGRISDIYARRQKTLLLIVDTMSAGCFVWFACMSNGILPRSKALIYIAAITGGMFVGTTGPLFLEISCEISYPVSEGISAGFLGFIINFAATAFLLITLIPNLQILALNWVLCGVLGLAVPLLVLAKVNYQRVNIDIEYSQTGGPSIS